MNNTPIEKISYCDCIEFHPKGLMNNDGDGYCIACSKRLRCICGGTSVNKECIDCGDIKELLIEEIEQVYREHSLRENVSFIG